ncbi:hypothetical protein FKM82_016427 [Ascaphus truei]
MCIRCFNLCITMIFSPQCFLCISLAVCLLFSLPVLQYGKVLNILISSKKKGSAIVEFDTFKAADLAVKNEAGFLNNPLKVSWLDPPPPSLMQENAKVTSNFSSRSAPPQGSVRSERDFESLVMMKMRQAAERQKLIEQLQQEDEDSNS